MRNYFTFDGVDSRSFGVYISGQGTFKAPARSYDAIEIPGRNGALLGIDSRLSNVELTYPAFIYSNFAENIAAFRVFLLSHKGYFKLKDSYHPDEFRLAYYPGPFEPDVTSANNAGSFDITFICKPQRYLESGQEVVELSPSTAQVETYTGIIAEIEPGIGDRVTGLTVPFIPIQDLHGYSHPWPAGGGVNILPAVSEKGNGFINDYRLLSDGTTVFMGTYYISQYFPVTPGKTYTYSVMNYGSDTTSCAAFYDSEYNFISAITGKPNGNEAVAPSNAAYMRASNTKNDAELYYMLNEGPYSNICPISGRTGLSVYDDPKYGGTIDFNQKFPPRTLNYTGTNYTITSANDGKYVITTTATITESGANHTYIYATTFTEGHVYALLGSKDGIQIQLKGYSKSSDTIFKASSALFNNVTFVFSNVSAGTYDVYPMLFDLTQMFGATKAEEILALENGNTGDGVAWVKNLFPKEYYAYNSGTTTCVSAVNGDPYWKKDIDWTSEAGTVYGGTPDVVTGALSSEWANIASYNGETITEPWLSSMDEYAPGATPTTGAQVVYKLATPLTYQLTPQDITLIQNALNYIWSNAGPVTVEVTEGLRVTNPTLFDALPFLRVYGTGILGIGSHTITITAADVYTDIDCEMMDCFKGSANKNQYVQFSGNDFPTLEPGVNGFTFSGITKVEVKPRWWSV